MSEMGLLSVVRRKRLSEEQYNVQRELKKNLPPDLLMRNFSSAAPGRILVEDVTYLYCLEKMYYLNTIEDLYSRRVVAFAIGDRIDSELCVRTLGLLSDAIDTRGCIIHSDEGSTYRSLAYRMKMKEIGAVQSMGKGKVWDNAAMESFNGVFKTECMYAMFGKTKFKDRRIRSEQVIERVEPFIHYYNSERPKEALGELSPDEFLKRNPRGTLPVAMQKQNTLPPAMQRS